MSYSPALWATIRAHWETGNYKSIDDLYINLSNILPKKLLKDLPSIDAVRVHSSEEGWNSKASLKEVYADAFKRIGINSDYIAGTVKQMIESTKVEVTPSRQVDTQGNKEPGFAEIVPDWWTRDKGIGHFKDLTGAKAADKQEVEHKQTGNITVTVKVVKAK